MLPACPSAPCRCFQPRAFISFAQAAVRDHLGANCVVADPVEFESAYATSMSSMPIVLISSQDQPLPQLMMYAEQKNIRVGAGLD